ncbi:MAG: hypothetical protein ACLS4Z_03565 [Christensenellaceae bacterium]
MGNGNTSGWNGSEYAEGGYRPVKLLCEYMAADGKGAEMNLYWLFRTHPNGHELGHGALFSPAGRAYRVSEEVQKAAKEFEKCGEFLTNTRIRSKIALHYSSTAHNSLRLRAFTQRLRLPRNAYSKVLRGIPPL